MTAKPLSSPDADAHHGRRPLARSPRARRLVLRRRVLPIGLGLGALALLASGCLTRAGVANDTLTITGSGGADKITLRLKAGDPNTIEVDDGADGTADRSFDRQTFSKIVVDGGAGDDVLRIDHVNGAFSDTELTTLVGGDGNDTLIGDVGPETLDGGAGSDFMDGKQGSDVMLGGDDADVVQWDPGDGSDVVEGGAGVDRLRFNGANIGEIFDVSANGGRVRFTRDVASIAMDMDGVETLSVTALGGADRLTVGNMAGTDLAEVDANLAASGGGDDGQPDEVVVAPGTTMGQDGASTTVDGLGAQVRVQAGAPTDRIHVTGTSPADKVTVAGTPDADSMSAVADGTDVAVLGLGLRVQLTAVPALEMDLGGGDDTFSATGNLAALVKMTVNGEAGNDTLLGGNGADVLSGGPGADFLDGNQGSDVLLGGDDADVVQWDPGDGSDVVEGGAGVDRLRFNGANIGEIFDVSANGGRVRFTRNVGTVAMDVNGVETLDVNALGGADSLTVNDLAGTGLSSVNVNLAAVGGAADGSVDDVIVNGTPGDDTITVDGAGSTLDVQGLAAAVHVTGTDPTLDRLTVRGLAGADTITPSAGAGSVMLLSLEP